MNDPILIIEWALALIILFAAVFIAIGNDRDGRGMTFTPWSKAEDFAGMESSVRGAGCCPMGDRSTGPLAKIRVGAPVA